MYTDSHTHTMIHILKSKYTIHPCAPPTTLSPSKEDLYLFVTILDPHCL